MGRGTESDHNIKKRKVNKVNGIAKTPPVNMSVQTCHCNFPVTSPFQSLRTTQHPSLADILPRL